LFLTDFMSAFFKNVSLALISDCSSRMKKEIKNQININRFTYFYFFWISEVVVLPIDMM
jgi:hypothetical protein